MANAKQKQQPASIPIKVADLRPGTSGHSLTVKVLSVKLVQQKSRQMRLAECIVGDDTGVIIFVARSEQADLVQEGATVVLQNARVEMFRGSMRIGVDKRTGSIDPAEPAGFSVKDDNNLSLIEFDTIIYDE